MPHQSYQIITVGGATVDTFIDHQAAECLTLSKRTCTQHYIMLETGTKAHINNIEYHIGGGAANTASSFTRLGFNTACAYATGKDAPGEFINQYLAQAGININLIQQSTTPTGQSFIIKPKNHEQSLLTYRGANDNLDLQAINPLALTPASNLYITSLGKQTASNLPAFTQQAHKGNLSIAINPGTNQLEDDLFALKECLPYTNILIMNGTEAKLFMLALSKESAEYKEALQSSWKSPCTRKAQEQDAYMMNMPIPYENYLFSTRRFFKEVMKIGPKIVVITNGSNGVYAAENETVYFHPSIPTDIVSTVGAGDAFGSCFVASLMHKNTVAQALINGIINSASVLKQLGAQEGLLDYSTIQKQAQILGTSKLQTFSLYSEHKVN